MGDKYPPTDEQAKAIEAFATGGDLKIEAGAGTGKTSTLVFLAENAMGAGRRGQYVAFNKAIVVEATGKMPDNMTCSTAHSLAFRAVGRTYSKRLNGPRMRGIDIARNLRIDPFKISYGAQSKTLAAGYLAGVVMSTIGKFCQSADEAPKPMHVPYIDGIDVPTESGSRTWKNNDDLRQHLMPYVHRAWQDLTDTRGQLPFKHDHYLKLWQLSDPQIDADFVLFDEAQDANPVMEAIVSAQRHAQLVWVGDSQQQIYTFTGAVNALDRMKAENVCYLTQSFRFGQPIADVANGLLERLEAELRLVGHPGMADVSRVEAHTSPDCILTRTNATAVRTLLTKLGEGRHPYLVGGGTEVLSFAKGAQELSSRGHTSHPELACFGSWGDVQDYVANDQQGAELRLMVNLIDEFGTDVIIDTLSRISKESAADLVISTGHKAKGREWDNVQVASDFKPPKGGGESGEDELRLMYVAATRAKLCLDVTQAPQLLAPQEDDKK